jgi:hypothetical protein
MSISNEREVFLMSIREIALSKKGTFARVDYSRPCKVRKGSPEIIKHTTINNCRIGAQYDALKSTKEAKGVTTTAEAHALNTGLNGMTWVNYPTILKSDKTGKNYVRIETNKNTRFNTTYEMNGKPVSKAEIEGYLLASEKKSGEMPTVMNIGLDTITKLS